jgi:replicative DNA helicase
MNYFDAEHEILGIMLNYPETQKTVCMELNEDHFTHGITKELFKTIKNNVANNDIISWGLTICGFRHTEFAIKNQFTQEDYEVFYDRFYKPADIKYFINYLKEGYDGKKLAEYVDMIKDLQETYIFEGEEKDKIYEICKKILEKRETKKHICTLKEIHSENLELYKKIESGEIVPNVVKTDWQKLDHYLKGFLRQDLTFIIARSGIGKTRFMIDMIQRISMISRNVDKSCYMFSLEEPKEKISNLFVSRATGINSAIFKNYDFKEECFKKLFLSYEPNLPVMVDDERMDCDLDYIERRIEVMTETFNIRNYFVDTANEIKRKVQNEKDHMDMVASKLKSICKRYDCRIFALAQMNRNSEGSDRKEERRPQVSDIKGSDAIYQNSDTVLGLYFDDFYKVMYGKTNFDKKFEISVLKTRDGLKGTIIFDAEHGTCKFTEERDENKKN